MRIEGNPVLAFLLGDAQADRMVPRTGITAWLTVFVSVVMGFLAVFAIALAVSTERLAQDWSDELAQNATVRVSAPAGQIDVRTAAVLAALETTPGVAAARVLPVSEQVLLLEPWLGPDLPLAALPVPRMIEVIADQPPYDPTNLRLRLEGEAPGAVLDDHSRWREPLVKAANRVRTIGWATLVLITGALAALIALAANATLAANTQVIEVLRLVGARDVYIARAFVRRFTARAGLGGVIGASLATSGIALIRPSDDASGFLTSFGFQGAEWLWPISIPFIAGLVAFWTTRTAALATLKRNA